MKTLTPPEFDEAVPWGSFRPQGWRAVQLSSANHLPANAFVRRLSVALKAPLRQCLSTPLDVKRWGMKMRLLPRGNRAEQDLLFLPQFFAREERNWLRDLFPLNGVFIDVGANIGSLSFWLNRHQCRGCKLHAIEPDPELRRRIYYTKQLNKLDGLQIHNCAIGDHDGEAIFYINKEDRAENSLDISRGTGSSLSVPLVSLLGFFNRHQIERPDIVKLNTNGSEDAVLEAFFRDAPRNRWPATWLISIRHRHDEMLAELLRETGYQETGHSPSTVLYRQRQETAGS